MLFGIDLYTWAELEINSAPKIIVHTGIRFDIPIGMQGQRNGEEKKETKIIYSCKQNQLSVLCSCYITVHGRVAEKYQFKRLGMGSMDTDHVYKIWKREDNLQRNPNPSKVCLLRRRRRRLLGVGGRLLHCLLYAGLPLHRRIGHILHQ